jgi:predicted CoA-binding protein
MTDNDEITQLLRSVRRIAVLGIKTEEQRGQPAFEVPRYMQGAGFEVIPVPVYYPDVTEILGQKVYRTLLQVPGPIDLVNVFRRPKDLLPHLDDILAKRPGAVWLQSGISHPLFAERLEAEGIRVVQNRCLMVEHRVRVAA